MIDKILCVALCLLAISFAPANADETLGALTPGSAIGDTDLFYSVQGGNDRSITGAQVGAKAPVQSVAGRTGTVTLSSSDVFGLATSATTDTTNAANISSGTLPDARLSNTITAAGPVGDATHIPQITFDAHGRLTTVTSVATSPYTPPKRGYVTNWWYTSLMTNGTTGSGGLNTTNTFLSLGYVSEQITISSLGARITTAGSSNIQLGIYNHNTTTGRPGTLIDHTGAIVNTSTGPVNSALGGNQQIGPGWYWFGAQTNDGTVRWAALTGTGTNVFSSSTVGSSSLGDVVAITSLITGVNTAQAYGTWGDLTSASFTNQTGASVCPFVGFQVASEP